MLMKKIISRSVFLILVVSLFGCNKDIGFSFTEYGTSHGAIGITITSESNFKKNEAVTFDWTLENISDESIFYKGTPFVVMRLKNDNGEYVDGIPNVYDSYAIESDYDKGIINEGSKVFENLKKGAYTMEIEADWLQVDSKDLEPIKEIIEIKVN